MSFKEMLELIKAQTGHYAWAAKAYANVTPETKGPIREAIVMVAKEIISTYEQENNPVEYATKMIAKTKAAIELDSIKSDKCRGIPTGECVLVGKVVKTESKNVGKKPRRYGIVRMQSQLGGEISVAIYEQYLNGCTVVYPDMNSVNPGDYIAIRVDGDTGGGYNLAKASGRPKKVNPDMAEVAKERDNESPIETRKFYSGKYTAKVVTDEEFDDNVDIEV